MDRDTPFVFRLPTGATLSLSLRVKGHQPQPPRPSRGSSTTSPSQLTDQSNPTCRLIPTITMASPTPSPPTIQSTATSHRPTASTQTQYPHPSKKRRRHFHCGSCQIRLTDDMVRTALRSLKCCSHHSSKQPSLPLHTPTTTPPLQLSSPWTPWTTLPQLPTQWRNTLPTMPNAIWTHHPPVMQHSQWGLPSGSIAEPATRHRLPLNDLLRAAESARLQLQHPMATHPTPHQL